MDSGTKRSREDGEEDGAPAADEAEPAEKEARTDSAPAPANTSSKPPRATPLMRQREVMEMERSGELKFIVITNDGSEETMVQLIALKNIFAKQLPKMPKEYIVRLVFDRNHYSLVCMNDGEIVGGVCYRPHFTQGFAEIAFCAVTATRQVKGFGTRMMNQLKQAAKKDGIEYFLTYADNYAIGYFKKQGFSRQVTMKRERWVGFIKDYDGGTLMECSISEHIDYTNLPKMIEAQRQAILERMRTMSSSHVMQTPITERHTFPLDEHGDVIGSRGPIQTAADIPGLAETGVQLPRYEYTLAGEKSTLSAIIERALQALVSHADSWPFLAPVDVTEAPDYYEVIKRPIDLAMAQRRLEIGYYRTLRMFTADIRMMCKNCLTYNGEENIYADCANTMISLHDSMLSDAQEVRCDAEAAG